MKLDKRGQVAIYITWFLVAGITFVDAGVLAPMGVLFNSEMYRAGEDILDMAEDDLDGIQDAEVRASIQVGIDGAQAEAETNINNLSDMYQYGWIIVLVLSGIVMFIFTRRVVEFSGGNSFV